MDYLKAFFIAITVSCFPNYTGKLVYYEIKTFQDRLRPVFVRHQNNQNTENFMLQLNGSTMQLFEAYELIQTKIY